MVQTQTRSWKPDTSLFAVTDNGELHGIRRVRDARAAAHVPDGINVSTNADVRAAAERLVSGHVPPGFSQHQLPIVLEGSDTMHFITRCEPLAAFPEHVHRDDDGLRVVVSGSLEFRGERLSEGDWFYVPRGEAYAFTAGEEGCVLYHVYKPAIER